MKLPTVALLTRAAVITTCMAVLPCVLQAAESAAGRAVSASVRLSSDQYRQSIRDVFGPAIKLNGRFEPGVREDGMLAVGARKIGITDSGMDRYDELARGIARQVVDPAYRDTFIQCKPSTPAGASEACARAFLSRVGRLLYRRPLLDSELNELVGTASQTADKMKDFYAGISTSLATMLISPQFLFRFTFVEPDPSNPGHQRMDGYSRASTLSFFLWNTTPDDELLRAAEKGELRTAAGLTHQVDRMTSSPRVEGAVRAFFSDMFRFSDYETMAKDPKFYPLFTRGVKEDSMEQTLRTIVDHLVVNQGDYRDLFTTPHTYLTRSLAALYGISLIDTTENGQPDRWMPYTYGANDPRVGILSQVSFVALHSPAGRSSPTLRGKAVREILLCQQVPPPPGNVDFSIVQQTSNSVYKTARERQSAHATNPVCAGCHKITDPIGLALENFDSAGQFRTTENGAQIDPSGQLNGAKFADARGLGEVLRNDPGVTTCVAKRAFAYGAGFGPQESDPRWGQIVHAFQESKYKFVELMRQIAMSEMLFELPATAESTH